jgi:hypothetical protein
MVCSTRPLNRDAGAGKPYIVKFNKSGETHQYSEASLQKFRFRDHMHGCGKHPLHGANRIA